MQLTNVLVNSACLCFLCSLISALNLPLRASLAIVCPYIPPSYQCLYDVVHTKTTSRLRWIYQLRNRKFVTNVYQSTTRNDLRGIVLLNGMPAIFHNTRECRNNPSIVYRYDLLTELYKALIIDIFLCTKSPTRAPKCRHQRITNKTQQSLKSAFNNYPITYLERKTCIQDIQQHQHNSIHIYSSANSVNGLTKGR